MVYLLSAQYVYSIYCCRASEGENSDYIGSFITGLSKLHLQEMLKIIKDIRNRNPFQLCDAITKLREETSLFLINHAK